MDEDKKLLQEAHDLLINLIAYNWVPDEICPTINDLIEKIYIRLTYDLNSN